jgi:hypothetical protein
VSLKQKVLLELEDGTEVPVVFDGRDLRAWEVKHRKSSLAEPMSMSMLTWLGWHATTRQHLLNGSYDTYEAFDAVCVGVEGAELDEAEGGPTRPGAKRGSRKTVSDS